MNRQLKRMQEKQDRLAETSQRSKRPSPKEAAARQRQHVGAKQFTNEVIGEMRKVLWPTRQQVATSSMIVVVVVIVMMTYIWALDLGAQKLIDLVYGT